MRHLRSPRVASGDPVRDSLLVLTVLAVFAAGWFGWSWASAAHDTELSVANERDAALEAATHGLVTLHTIDHRSVEDDLDEWVAVTAGELHEDLSGGRESQRDRAERNEMVSTARMLRAAVTDIDPYQDSARVIAVLEVDLAGGGEEASSETRRMNASLSDTEDGWKITAVEAAS